MTSLCRQVTCTRGYNYVTYDTITFWLILRIDSIVRSQGRNLILVAAFYCLCKNRNIKVIDLWPLVHSEIDNGRVAYSRREDIAWCPLLLLSLSHLSPFKGGTGPNTLIKSLS